MTAITWPTHSDPASQPPSPHLWTLPLLLQEAQHRKWGCPGTRVTVREWKPSHLTLENCSRPETWNVSPGFFHSLLPLTWSHRGTGRTQTWNTLETQRKVLFNQLFTPRLSSRCLRVKPPGSYSKFSAVPRKGGPWGAKLWELGNVVSGPSSFQTSYVAFSKSLRQFRSTVRNNTGHCSCT